jgi:hypothetical protein
MKDGRAIEPPHPLMARLVTIAGLVQAVAGWTVVSVHGRGVRGV